MVNNSVANATQHPQDDSVMETRMSGAPADETPAVDHDPAPDPYDPERLKLGQDFRASVGVKKVLTTVKCRRPHRQEFFRVREGHDWRLETAAFEDKTARETYLVDPAMWSEMMDEIIPVCLFTAITRQGDVFLWACKMPGQDGKSNDWYDSALEAAKLAQSRWVRMAANMPAGCYDTYVAAAELSEPEWPEVSFQELLKLSFKDRFIRSADHPVLKQLRGEA